MQMIIQCCKNLLKTKEEASTGATLKSKKILYGSKNCRIFYLQLNMLRLVLQHIAMVMITETDRVFIKSIGMEKGVEYKSMLQDYPERKS